MTESTVLFEKSGAVGTVILNRPTAMNTLNKDLAQKLLEILMTIEFDASIRCVVLRGAGDHFMAGGDIKMFAGEVNLPSAERRAQFHQMIQHIHPAIQCLQRMPKPVVACVRGAVAGFGVSLMSACDLVMAGESSFFTMAYAHLGLSPDGGSTYFLPRTLGVKKAMELALLSDRVTVEDARAIGLVNWVVPDAALEAECGKLATRLSQGPRTAYAQTKALLNTSFDHTLESQLVREEGAFAACAAEEDFKEAVSAFLEKRPVQFKIA